MKQWFYIESGEQSGPVNQQELVRLLESNKIPSHTLVWSEGMTDWKAAATFEELALSPYAPPSAAPLAEADWSGYMPSGPQSRPWVRYWARTCDFLAFALISGVVLEFAAPQVLEIPDTAFGIILMAAYNFVEPVMFAVWGTTPAKALLKVRVRNQDGSKLTYAQAFRRILKVWIRGEGLGIPVITLVTHITSYSRLNNHGITSWDAEGAFVISHQQIAWWRWFIMIFLLVAIIGLTIYGATATE
jgi:hypothetical protein